MQQRTARARGFHPFRVYPIEETLQYFDWFAEMRAEHPVFSDEQTRLWQVFRYNDVGES